MTVDLDEIKVRALAYDPLARDDIEALIGEIEAAHRELDEHDRVAPPRSKVPELANRVDQAIDRLYTANAERDRRLAAIRELVQPI